jgi:hypothetical protein
MKRRSYWRREAWSVFERLMWISTPSAVHRVVLPLAHFVIGLLDPERLNRLVAENVVPVVGLRSADAFQGLFRIICNAWP